MRMRLPVAASFAVALLTAGPAEADDQPVRFNRDIQPIFAENCLECHGPDEANRAAELRLDDASALADRGGYRAIAAGEPDLSEVLHRITSDHADERMPPPETGYELSEDEIELMRRWIAEGAEYEPHWAFVAAQRPEPPDVEQADWVRNPVDRFVLAKLEAEGLQPSPEAARRTLVRRLALDLTGLPPEPDLVERYLADDQPGAYARVVEALLASPHYGERWAVPWLDIARYGDTDGYDFDRPRDTWLYRDWVVHAFNEDMPYDRFVLKQLAADLLQDATDWDRVATGFIRNSPVPQYEFDVLVDRVTATGTAFLGLSFECAQCHDHKYDPISQREFYEIMAIFNNDAADRVSAESPLSGESGRSLVVRERDEPRPTHIAVGGSWLNPGDRVEPGAPGSLHPLPDDGVNDRLSLAEWIVDPANPLLARVTVNRHWEALFGTGIVLTSEDLGVRAAQRSHPELLDWLAVEFVDSGWSLKHLHRLLVTSATYRQDSAISSPMLARDPQNRLLARGPRFRVEGEVIRDISLAASGLLDRRVGGPSVHPPQPDGVSENRFRGAYNWEDAEGPDRYRRGLYTYWKRGALYPSLEIFDAPRREAACARRRRSNNPLQALVTLNDPAFVEAAVMLGRRMINQDSADPAARIGYAFERCVVREPDDRELQTLLAFYEAERERFSEDPDAARKLLGSAPAANERLEALGEAERDELIGWAASAMVANVLLSLDETITKP